MTTPLWLASVIAGLFGFLGVVATVSASRKTSSEDFTLKRRAADTLDREKIDAARDALNKEMLDLWHERIKDANDRADREKARADKLEEELKAERAKHAPKVEPMVTELPAYNEVSTSRIEL